MMNASEIINGPQSATGERKPEAASPMPLHVSAASFSRRAWRQFCHECRRQRFFLALIWIGVAVMAGRTMLVPEPRPQRAGWSGLEEILSPILLFGIFVLLPFWVAGQCAWASRPAALNLAVHTRPVGRVALWLGQIAFLIAAVIAPRAVSSLLDTAGCQFPLSEYGSVVAGSALLSLVIVGVAAALPSVARTGRQFAAVVTAALVVATASWGLLSMGTGTDNYVCQWWALTAWIALGTGAAWTWYTLGWWRFGTLLLLGATLVGAPLFMAWWRWDWMTGEPVRMGPSSWQLTLVKADEPLPPDTTLLWDNIGVKGLPPGSATVVGSFGPDSDQAPNYFQYYATQYGDADHVYESTHYYNVPGNGPRRHGLESDFIRALVQRDPEWTWHDTESATRPHLPVLWQRQKADRSRGSYATSDKWRMDLRVYEPRLILEVQLRELRAREHRLSPAPGCRMLVQRAENLGDLVILNAILDRCWPGLKGRPQQEQVDAELSRAAWLAVVFLNDARRVAQVDVATAREELLPSVAAAFSRFRFGAALSVPELRTKLTGLEFDTWVDQVRVQLWWPEPTGSVILAMPEADVERLAKPQATMPETITR